LKDVTEAGSPVYALVRGANLTVHDVAIPIVHSRLLGRCTASLGR
jgi:hypothetical protein